MFVLTLCSTRDTLISQRRRLTEVDRARMEWLEILMRRIRLMVGTHTLRDNTMLDRDRIAMVREVLRSVECYMTYGYHRNEQHE